MGLFSKFFNGSAENDKNKNGPYREIPENKVLRYKVKGRCSETNQQKNCKDSQKF